MSYQSDFNRFIIFLTTLIALIAGTGEAALPPDGVVFTYMSLLGVSYILARICRLIHIPPLIGMIIGGFMLINLTSLPLNQVVTTFFRSLALIVILLRAGLSINIASIKRNSWSCLKLSLIPFLFESSVIAILTRYLINLPWLWSFLIGYVAVATSPAIIVPAMISFNQQNLGTRKGIPTLLMASCGVDNVLSITGFEIIIGFVFADVNASHLYQILAGPAQIATGLILGACAGLFLWYAPLITGVVSGKKMIVRSQQRTYLLIIISLAMVMGAKRFNFLSSGPLAVLTMSLLADLRYDRSCDNIGDFKVTDLLADLWSLVEIFLFGLIGCEMRISLLKSSTVGWCVLIVIIAMLARFSIVILMFYGSQFNSREKIFLAISWLPKGSVQAAIGSIALDMARERVHDPDYEDKIQHSSIVLIVAILAVFLSAPLSAFLLEFFGPKLLVDNDDISDDSDSMPCESCEENERRRLLEP